jgi:pyruvate/2-oxoglutarate dehydrogenase complex dihydrolipoamide dehydrogenase (E3) component
MIPMKSSPPYELIVIGGGSAGHAAASHATRSGLHCALVESAPVLGGLCILKGCMPSKTLVETANRMRDIRQAAHFGIRSGPAEIDLPALHQRLASLIGEFHEARLKSMLEAGYDLIRARAHFVTPEEISLTHKDGSTETLRSRTFIIATGSSPSVPDIPGLAQTPYWTSDDAVGLPYLPGHVAILGSGVIGMEFAHLFEGLGCHVTVIGRNDRVLAGHDPDLSATLGQVSRDRGISLELNTTLRRVRHDPSGFHLDLENGSQLQTDALLIATGRTPNTHDLGLEDIGVAMENGSIIIDQRAATSLRCIFAAGDCASPVPVVHLAVIQGEVAAHNACRSLREGHATLPAVWNPDSAMAALFTQPQAVVIGTDEATARRNGIPIVCGRSEFADHGRSLISGNRCGFLKVIAEAETGCLIGATAVGPLVAETGHLLQFAIDRCLTTGDYLELPHYHPTLTEAWSRAVADAHSKRKAPTD